MHRTKQESKLGIYVQHGKTALDDVFYHQLHGMLQETYVEVRATTEYRPRIVHVERGEDWKAVGSYSDSQYDVVVTTEMLASQLKRVASALIDQARTQEREKQVLHEILEGKDREINKLQGAVY